MALKKKKKTSAKKKILKRRSAKKTVARKPAKKKAPAIKRKKENIIGVVTHYFPKVNAGVIKLKSPLKVGDTIKIKGHTTDFTQTITSMQIDHVPINEAKKGDEIGLLVNSRVRRRDKVIKT